MSEIDESVVILIERAKSGDSAAFADLYSAYVAPIFRYIYSRVHNRQDAEDITQSVFMRAWTALGRYEERGMPFSAWLYRIAHNSTIDHYKKKKDIIFDEPEALEQFVAGDEASPHAYAESVERVRVVERALSLVPETQRKVLTMRFIEGYSTKEIATQLGKSEEATRQIQSRALRALREQLRETI